MYQINLSSMYPQMLIALKTAVRIRLVLKIRQILRPATRIVETIEGGAHQLDMQWVQQEEQLGVPRQGVPRRTIRAVVDFKEGEEPGVVPILLAEVVEEVVAVTKDTKIGTSTVTEVVEAAEVAEVGMEGEETMGEVTVVLMMPATMVR